MADRRSYTEIVSRGQALQRPDPAVNPLITWLLLSLCVLSLIWPALWNGYPIVFSDSGTYLSQATHRYLGWDRPVFYSLFIFPLHLGLTTWPVILVQSCLTVLVLDRTRRAFGVSRWWLFPLTAFLAVTTSLPWIVSELMPDLFTPLLVLLLSLLVFSQSYFRRWQRIAMTALAAFMIATQQSSVPLAIAFLATVLPLRWIAVRLRTGPRSNPEATSAMLAPLLAPGLAIVAMVLVNAIGFGRVSLSPFGNVFVLARVIYDGPGMTVLRRECPASGWRLCPYLDRFPPTSDEFLWEKTSPIMLAGGHKAVSADADAIIHATMQAEPMRLAAATWDNALQQLTRFASGDGLEAWPSQVGSWIDADFPLWESTAFHNALQQTGTLAVPRALGLLHRVTALAGIAAAVVLLPVAWRRRHAAAWFLAGSLLTLLLGAAITGGLSTPHDRYQSRIVWLPAAMAFLSVPALIRRRPGHDVEREECFPSSVYVSAHGTRTRAAHAKRPPLVVSA